MDKQYEIFGGDHGNYTISLEGNAAPVVFVRRNQKGGGYTVSRHDESRSVLMRSMPTAYNGQEQAAEIMALLDAKCSTVPLDHFGINRVGLEVTS